MLELALAHGAGPVSITKISSRQDISYKYLEQIVKKLREAGLVRSIRGARGGYVLARPPAEITMSHIVTALEGRLSGMTCVDDPDVCHRSGLCASRDVWTHLENQIVRVLDSITLADLVARHRAKHEGLASSFSF
jgi:Rrf2 family protein